MRLQFLQSGSFVQFDRRGRISQRLQRFDELPGSRDREMVKQSGAVGPLLEKHQFQRVLAVDMDRVRDASGLKARAMDVLEAEAADFVKAVLPRGNTAGHHDHLDFPPFLLSLAGLAPYSAAV